MAEREAVTRLKVEGADQAAADMKKVSDAQREQTEVSKQQEGVSGEPAAAAAAAAVASATQDATEATQQVTEATEQYSGSAANLAAVLATVHPSLGGLVTVLENAFKLTGDLGKANIDLTKIIPAVTNAVKGNAASYLTLGAGGAVVIGLLAIYKAWQQIEEAIAAAIKATKEFADAQTALGERRRATEEELADALSEQKKGTTENLEQAMKYVEFLERKGLGDKAVQIATAFAGTETTKEQVARAAAAAEIGLLDLGAADAGAALEGLLRRPEAIAAIEQQQAFRAQRVGTFAQRALDQAMAFGTVKDPLTYQEMVHAGQEDVLRRWLEDRFGLSGEALDRRLRFMRYVIAAQEKRAAGKWSDLSSDWLIPREDFGPAQFGAEREQAEMALEALRQEAGQSPADLIPGGLSAQPGRIEIHHHHQYLAPQNQTTITRPNYYKDFRGGRNVRSRSRERDLAGIG